jgi:hypothetical protein
MTAKMSTRESPLIGLEPAMFPPPDFEFGGSTNSASRGRPNDSTMGRAAPRARGVSPGGLARARTIPSDKLAAAFLLTADTQDAKWR